MEIAIPLIALGGMYVISNQTNNQSSKNNVNRENYTNMGLSKQNNSLPNINIPPQNYPVINNKQLVDDALQNYPNPNVATDKYFNQNAYEQKNIYGEKTNNNIPNIYSLTGNYLDSTEFKHNNMVPFVGGKAKSYTYNMDMAETILDNMNGNGSQINRKVEQAPLFKPQENIQHAYGMPNHSDFYQSRVNPGMRNNNVKPFLTETVGPGLDQGYSSIGTGGFNSGMQARDKWLPKTVDQLRVETNPKIEYSLESHEGPSYSQVKNIGLIGRVEKNLPDTFFINTQDRWLTTTGLEKGETLRPIQEMGIIKRPNDILDYKGTPGSNDKQAGYADQNYEVSKRNETVTLDVPHSSARGRGPSTDMDNYMKSHTNYVNNRASIKQPDTLRSGFGGAIGAVIAPLLDILKPSRKEETISNVRIYGDMKPCVSSNYVINPKDVTPTTIKETTIYSPTFNIDSQKEGNYINNYTPMDFTQRDSTSCSSLGAASSNYGPMDYNAVYKQTNNDIKSQTIHNRANQGGMQMFNQQMNVSINKNDKNHLNNRVNAASSVIKMPPSLENYGKINNVPQYSNQNIGCERIQPDLLNAFRSNPYTHSLNTSV